MNLKIKIKRYALLLLFSPSIFAAGAIAHLEQDLADFHTKSGAGYAAIITLDGKSQYQDAVGKANIELDVALNIAHKFEIGSLTKQFTAVAILHLVQSGKLKLSDDITQFISGISTARGTVTIEHLLAHTSGLVDPINEPEFLATRVQENITLDSLIDMFKNNHWQTKAGERAYYSNVGYSMLAKIIEQVSGLSYFEYLNQHFLEPLGMNSTQQFSFAICSNKSAGYTYEGKTLRNKDYLDISWAYGAADLISNTTDLAIWTHALMQGQILKPEYLKILTSPITLNNGEVTNGSYTFSLEKIHNFEAIRMSGSTFGYSSHSIYLPKQRLYVLVQSNADGIHQGAWISSATVAAKLLASYLQLNN